MKERPLALFGIVLLLALGCGNSDRGEGPPRPPLDPSEDLTHLRQLLEDERYSDLEAAIVRHAHDHLTGQSDLLHRLVGEKIERYVALAESLFDAGQPKLAYLFLRHGATHHQPERARLYAVLNHPNARIDEYPAPWWTRFPEDVKGQFLIAPIESDGPE